MKIKNRKEFEDLLLANGWTDASPPPNLVPGSYRPWRVVSPYDENVVYTFYDRRMSTKNLKHVYGSVPNFRDISWEYNESSGCVTNGVFAIRIK